MSNGTLTMGEIRKLLAKKKGYMIPKEELDIYYENMEARKLFHSKEGIKELYATICKEALDEYKRLRKSLWKIHSRSEQVSAEKSIAQLEDFFGTDLFLNMSGCRSKEHVLEQVKEIMKHEAQKRFA